MSFPLFSRALKLRLCQVPGTGGATMIWRCFSGQCSDMAVSESLTRGFKNRWSPAGTAKWFEPLLPGRSLLQVYI